MDLPSSIRGRLDMLAQSQEDLAEARERLLVKREKIRSSVKRIRNQRLRTGNAEAALVDQLREYFSQHASMLPFHLNAAYTTVLEERDRLGPMEEDYLQAEETLGGEEWTYMEKENDLYQFDLRELLSEDFLQGIRGEPKSDEHSPGPKSHHVLPSISDQYQAALAEKEQLLRRFDTLRPKQAKILETQNGLRSRDPENLSDDAGFREQYNNLLDDITNCEVRIQKLRNDLTHEEGLATMATRRNSDLIRPSTSFLPVDVVSRSHSDSAMQNFRDDLATQHRIREWLLDYLKRNPLEKTQYLNILRHVLEIPDVTDLDFTSEEARTTYYWLSDLNQQFDASSKGLPLGSYRSSQSVGLRQDSLTSKRSFSNTIHPDERKHNLGIWSPATLGSTPQSARNFGAARETGVRTIPVVIFLDSRELGPEQDIPNASNRDDPSPLSGRELHSNPGSEELPSVLLNLQLPASRQQENVSISEPKDHLDVPLGVRHDSPHGSDAEEVKRAGPHQLPEDGAFTHADTNNRSPSQAHGPESALAHVRSPDPDDYSRLEMPSPASIGSRMDNNQYLPEVFNASQDTRAYTSCGSPSPCTVRDAAISTHPMKSSYCPTRSRSLSDKTGGSRAPIHRAQQKRHSSATLSYLRPTNAIEGTIVVRVPAIDAIYCRG